MTQERDFLGEVGTPGPWHCRGYQLTRDAIRLVANAIAAAPHGLYAYQITGILWHHDVQSFTGCECCCSRALRLLKRWGLIEFRRPDGGGPKAWHWIGERGGS